MKTLAQFADKFEKLLDRLPGPIRTPVEREWRPLRELFIHRRAPRILVIGDGAEAFIRGILCSNPGVPEEDSGVFENEGGPWHTFRHRGVLHFASASASTNDDGKTARLAIASAAPDCLVFLAGETVRPEDLQLLADLHRYDRERHGHPVPIVGAGAAPLALADALHGEEVLRGVVAAVLPADRRESILAAVARALPEEARLEFARVSGEKAIQREIANTLSRSTTAVCTAIGTQPIPLADFPILTSLQVLMVAGIIHIAGREWSKATARDFIGALGVNVGAGLLLREGARAAVKLLPGWGNAISGAVAGAGTYAMGRAATAYFIEGLPMEEARRRFRLLRRKKKPKALPPAE